MSILSNKQFKQKLATVIRSAKTQRDSIQALIVSGLELYREHGNAGQLTDIVQACVGVRSLPTLVIKEYIKEHANVAYNKINKDAYAFKKVGKDVEVQIPDVTWYDWEGNKNKKQPVDMDIILRTKAFLGKVEEAVTSHHFKGVNPEQAQELVQNIKKWLKSNDKSNVVDVTPRVSTPVAGVKAI